MSNQVLHEGKEFLDYEVMSIRDLPEYRSQGIRLIHRPTGAEVYHLANEDKENLFAFIFRTPPHDHSGVAHILEHTVLCGSRRFPLKDPFVTLLKGSMQTFLNAMTFPDKTLYPASSMVEKDFYNLMLVYGDAVFFPLLKEEAFKQEGCHVEFNRSEDPSSGLKLVGVVYNEMKGKYSSPEAIAADWSFRYLFPQTPYHFDSGGSPQSIPDLTFDDFTDFHGKYYHPSNGKIFLYGSIPTVDLLAFLQEHFLAQFSKRAGNSAIPDEPRWSAPQRFEITYPTAKGELLSTKSTVTLNWLTAPVTDPFTTISLEVLSEVLVGNAGSPLRKALVDSHLGEDIAPATGLETELKESVFSVGLRGTDPDSLESIESCILDTLATIRKRGVDEHLLHSALHRVKFRNREIKGGRGPYALRLMRRALNGWLHDQAPETTLECEQWIKAFEKKVSTEKDYLSALMEHYLLENNHRSTLLVRPDPDHGRREEERLGFYLKNLEIQLSDKDKGSIVTSTKRLRKFQETPDSPETLGSIPSLTRADLPREVERIPGEESVLPHGVPVFLHDIFTNGIMYIDLAFSTNGMGGNLSAHVPLFGKAACSSGLPGIPYDEVAKNLSLLTGGLSPFLSARTEAGSIATTKQHIFFRLRALRENIRPALDLVGKLLTDADFDDEERLSNLVLELRNESKASLIPSGHHMVALRAGSNLSPATLIEERWEGISQICFLEELTSGKATSPKDLSSLLKKLRSIISRKNAIINVTGERSFFDEVKDALGHFVSALPEGKKLTPVPIPEPSEKGAELRQAESFIVTSPVGFVAKAIRGARLGTEMNGYQEVLAHFLRTGYLWEKVRMRGGAYGAFAVPYSTEGIFIFSSYRDPNIIETLQAFQESLRYAESGSIDDDQIEKAIIGTVGQEEKPLDPGEKGFRNFTRRLYSITDELRQKRRQVMLETDRGALSLSARHLLEVFDSGFTVVMSNQKAILEAGKDLPELKECIHEIPG